MSVKNSKNDDVVLDRDGTEVIEKCHERLSHALVAAATGYIRQCILDAFLAHRNGRKSFESYGIDRDVIKQVAAFDPIELEELLYNYARSALMRSPTLANPDFEIDVLLINLVNHKNDKGMVDSYLLAGASNELMKTLFGSRASECANRRIALGIGTKRGRKTDKTATKTFHEVYDIYENAIKKIGCNRQALLNVHEETKLHIDILFRIVTSNNEFDL